MTRPKEKKSFAGTLKDMGKKADAAMMKRMPESFRKAHAPRPKKKDK